MVKKDGASFIIKLDRELNANDEISLIATSEGIPSISTVARVLDAPKLLKLKENGFILMKVAVECK